jgi:DNA-binding NtrC family response regulator
VRIKGLRILVVEDDRDLRESLAEALLDLGHLPVVASSIAEASRLTGTARPEVALVDLRLHESTPEFVAQQPSILTCAMSGPRAAAVAARAGLPILRKPFDLDELEGLLAEVANRAPPATSAFGA